MDLSDEKRAAMKQALEENGYCVIPNVMTERDCDKHIGQLKTWLDTFPRTHTWRSRLSLVKDYAVGHCEGAWATRLAAKTVFAALWDTDKLLTSMDAVAIAAPPVKDTDFDQDKSWLHCDQSALRMGLHAYQGAVYWEGASADDFCLRVLEKSHNCHQLFFNSFPSARQKSVEKEFYRLTKRQVAWYKEQGSSLKCVEVPKGGMVLWDSRVIHDNRPPLPDSSVSHRWRFVVFVSMTPAAWATPRDLEKKCQAYNELLLTNHYSSQKMRVLSDKTPHTQRDKCFQKLPKIAQSTEARRLAGVEPYDFDDGEPNGRPPPVWLEN